MTPPSAVLLVVLSAGLSSFACKTKTGSGPHGSPEAQTKGRDLTEDKSLSLIKKEDLVSRKKVHAIRLDSADFRISALRVGEQTFLRFATPVIVFEMPRDSDYVEILRCPSQVIVDGGADTIDNAELGSRDLETETKVFQQNNFWESAAASSGCVLIATSYTDISFEDTHAPTGEFVYYMRACVDEERLEGTEQFSTSHCSRFVSQSSPHKHTNQRSRSELAALEKAAGMRGRIDALNRQIVEKTMELNSQLYDCQERHGARVVSNKKHEAISGILAGVTALGIPAIYAMTGTGSRVQNALKAGVVGVAAASVLSSLYIAGSQTIPDFPRDAAACYNSESTRKIAAQIRGQSQGSGPDQALICTCAGALASQTELYTLAVDLKNQLKLQQSYLGQASSGVSEAEEEDASEEAVPQGQE